MRLTFLVIRSLVYASAFLWLWTWVARLLRRFDGFFGGPLPAWTETFGYGGLALGGGLVVWCIGAFIVQGRGTPAMAVRRCSFQCPAPSRIEPRPRAPPLTVSIAPLLNRPRARRSRSGS